MKNQKRKKKISKVYDPLQELRKILPEESRLRHSQVNTTKDIYEKTPDNN
jgi:hypothetical protein